MDTVTHIIAGVVLSEATFRRRIGRSANWLAALAAWTPDLDIVANWIIPDPWTSMEHHRGLTHALAMAPLLALVWAGVFFAVRRRQFLATWALACLAMFSHPILDLITSYGTQIFWPFTNQRYALDLLPIIDVILTPILLTTMVACWLSRRFAPAASGSSRVRGTPGANMDSRELPLAARSVLAPRSPVAPWIAHVGLLLAAGYVGLAGWMNYGAVQFARSAVPGDHGPVEQVRAGPLLGTTFARRVAVRTPEGFYVTRYNYLAPPDSPQWVWAPDATGRFVQAADTLSRVRLFRWFAMGMARPVVDRAHHRNGDSLVRVTYYDMRYGYPAESERSIFSAWVILDGTTGQVLEGPRRGRWSAETSPEGLAAFFDPPEQQAEPVSRWQRIRGMWREAWKR